jgi:Tfp pilus assembly protein PilF
VAILPFLLLLITWWQRRLTVGDAARLAPFFVIAVALTAINIWFQRHGRSIEFRQADFGERLAGAGAIIWFYLSKALLPIYLSFIYPQWGIRTDEIRWCLPLLAAVAVSAALVWHRKGRVGRTLLFAWAFFCLALAPAMGFTDVGYMRYSMVANHYQHIAIIGVITLVAAAGCEALRWLPQSTRAFTFAVAAAVVMVFAYLSGRQSANYRDPVTLYNAVLADNPTSWLAHLNLGGVLKWNGQNEDARRHFRDALRYKADFADAHYNLGVVLYEDGQVLEGIHELEEALRFNPRLVEAQNDLGFALAALGRNEAAIAHFEEALRIYPRYVNAHFNLAKALMRTGHPQEAIDHFEAVLRLKPDHAEACARLAAAHADSGDFDKAVEMGQRACELAKSQGQIRLAEATERALERYRQGLAGHAESEAPQ